MSTDSGFRQMVQDWYGASDDRTLVLGSDIIRLEAALAAAWAQGRERVALWHDEQAAAAERKIGSTQGEVTHEISQMVFHTESATVARALTPAAVPPLKES